MAHHQTTWGSKSSFSLLVGGVCTVWLSACGLEPSPATFPGNTTGAIQSTALTSGSGSTGTQEQGDATSPKSEGTESQTIEPKADCVGLDPEADLGGYARQDTTTGIETSSTASDSSSSKGTAEETGVTSLETTSTETTSTSSDTASSSTDSGSTTQEDEGPSTGEGGCVHPACIGDASVSWQLHDHQPLSCGFGQDYGQDVYYGKTTMVVLLAGWCDFCVRQTVGLEKLRLIWEQEGKDINILIINAASANSVEYRSRIVNSTSNPVFQDTTFSNVWGAMQGAKDAFFIYDGKGILRQLLLPQGNVNIDLSSEEGFAAVKQRAEMVLAEQ